MSATEIKELTEKRNSLFGQISKLRDEFNTAGKKWKDGEQAKVWDQVNKDYDSCMTELETAQNTASVESRFAAIEERNGRAINPLNIGLDDASHGRVGSRRAPGGDKGPSAKQLERARVVAMDGWFRHQMNMDVSSKQRKAARLVGLNLNRKQLRFRVPTTESLNALQYAFMDYMAQNRSRRFEYNAPLTTTTGSTGGNIIPPQTLLNRVEVNMLHFGAVRQFAETISTTGGEELGWPSFDDTSNEGRQLPENTSADDNAGTGSAGDGGPNMSFAKTTWKAYKRTSDTILVPYELMEDPSVSVVPMIGDALGERYGRGTNRVFTTGTGANEPQGIVTGAVLGVTAAGAAVITGDEVIDLEHSVDVAYRTADAGYMMHDLVLAHLRKLKGSDGHYLWQNGFNAGAPNTLNNRPYAINNHMATLATGNKTLIFGQLSKYKIRRAGTIRVYRLEERYRNKDQDGFVLFGREDGGVLNTGTAPIKYLVQA